MAEHARLSPSGSKRWPAMGRVPSCATCKKERPDGHACSYVECPVRKPGTSMRDLDTLPPWAGRHDGLAWDRFYKGQRKPPAPKEK